MAKDTGQVFRIEDYHPSDFLIPETKLTFSLHPTRTRVVSEIVVERRAGVAVSAPLVLDGDGLTLTSIEIDGVRGNLDGVEVTPERLVLGNLPPAERFTLRIETETDPSANKALMGLYLSNGVYCTQCEAEGFRRITYFLDRPDVMSVYTVRLEADATSAPLLLSNGNPGESGVLEGGRHYAVWHDPFPKPSYLFALVAGDLGCVKDRFTTMSGREVELGIYVEHGKQARACYAMDALKRSMQWDEEVFGREYDLDIFNIVAVSDFNMGAMENKGLNIFNDKYVLADEETATDADYANIEAIIAHEYFHNWTGNRITCRDWFQLCLKEGLTVFRDHEFSADQRSRAVKRIAEVRTLRALQFPEDQGPLAHPVRPRRYREINNFYTATVYEKGSEVVRMIRTIIGADAFRSGMDLYFQRHDGDAATIEDFIKVFEEVSGRDLSQFAVWYHQAGTPNIAASTSYDAAERTFTLELEQTVPATPSESRKRLMHIPIKFGLIGPDGNDMKLGDSGSDVIEGDVIHVRKRRHTLRFTDVESRPVVSLNRGFSAPVTLSIEQDDKDLAFLARHDSDPFSRWQAAHSIFTKEIIGAVKTIRGGGEARIAQKVASLATELAGTETLDPAFRALLLILPAEADIARDIGVNIDPDSIFAARRDLIRAIAARGVEAFERLRAETATDGPFTPDAASAGRRALRNVLLDYICAAHEDTAPAVTAFETATNMTDRFAALTVLAHRFPGAEAARSALAAFEARYRDDPLVLDKWFQVQATIPGADAAERVAELARHPSFSISNPNRVRSLIGSFASGNQTGFHAPDGSGYRFYAESIVEVEQRNPQVAARLATAFRSWRSLERGRREKAREAMSFIAAKPDLSRDLADIIERSLA